jgi:hypothetical protein
MFTGCTGNRTGQGATAFTPPYMYNLDSTGSVPGLIANNVGPR